MQMARFILDEEKIPAADGLVPLGPTPARVRSAASSRSLYTRFKLLGSSLASSLEKRGTPNLQSIESSDSGAVLLTSHGPMVADSEDSINRIAPGSAFSVDVLPAASSQVCEPTCDATPSRKIDLRHPASKSYLIARELLMTERTYCQDLSLLFVNFKKSASQVADASVVGLLDGLFSCLRLIFDYHTKRLLIDLELRLKIWEGSDEQQQRDEAAANEAADKREHRIGDCLLAAIHNSADAYESYASSLNGRLQMLRELQKNKAAFAACCNQFENEAPCCYLSLNRLLLRPLHRLLYWQNTLAKLISHYLEQQRGSEPEPDLSDCRVALDKLSPLLERLSHPTEAAENLVHLIELERDFIGVDNLIQPKRVFLREGSLQRLSRKGSVQRLFILFNDCLLYANRSATAPQNQTQSAPTASQSAQSLSFKLHGQIPLRGLMLEEEVPLKSAFSAEQRNSAFTIYGASRSLIVSAAGGEEKQLWMEDINAAVAAAKNDPDDYCRLPQQQPASSASLPTDARSASNSKEEVSHLLGTFTTSSTVGDSSKTAVGSSPNSSQCQQRSNDTVHVCWHRSTTVGRADLHQAGRDQLSGYLLRKFRNSTGWQKLWVIYGNFTLFFFKSHKEHVPLASLPLLGYWVGLAADCDSVGKDYVFKLAYKNHFYFFRADCPHSLDRWIETIRSATVSSTPDK